MPSSFSRRILVLSLVLTAGVVVLAGCPGRTISDGPDAGSGNTDEGPLTCESADECPDPANYDCVGGSCLQRCAADGVCKADEYCSARSYCEQGCRDSSTCEDGKVCANGDCIAAGGAGSCATKCDCDPGKVCSGGVCQDPPAECAGPADCGRGAGDQCEDYLCNGFTKQCFDDDPDPCSQNSDCSGRPGCQEGCLCSPNQQCVPAADCTAHDDCGAGFYCTEDLACDVVPSCAGGVACPSDLVCNPGTTTCEPPRPCTMDSECAAAAPATFCDTGTGSCVVPTCDNGGRVCLENQECVNGNCVAEGTGTACNSDADCPNDPWPNTQFCSFPAPGAAGECAIGCRSNASCTGGQQCNSSRQCVDTGSNPGGGGLGQVGDACDEPGFDPDCQIGTLCKLDTGTCEETCETPGPCTGGSCCTLSGYGNCTEGVFFNWCTP